MHSRAATAAALAVVLLVAGLAAPAAAAAADAASIPAQHHARPALAAAAAAKAAALPRRLLGELRGHASHRRGDRDARLGGFDGRFGPGERYESFMTGAGPYFGGIPRYAYGANGYAPAYVNRYGGQTSWTGWDWRR